MTVTVTSAAVEWLAAGAVRKVKIAQPVAATVKAFLNPTLLPNHPPGSCEQIYLPWLFKKGGERGDTKERHDDRNIWSLTFWLESMRLESLPVAYP